MERLTLEEEITHVMKVAVQLELDNEKKRSENYKLLEELKSYKEAEEQGLLVRLPCKVGDALYCIDNGIVETLIVNSFRIYNFNRVEIYFENASGFALCTFEGELDEGYFLTREEAEKKLKEMKK